MMKILCPRFHMLWKSLVPTKIRALWLKRAFRCKTMEFLLQPFSLLPGSLLTLQLTLGMEINALRGIIAICSVDAGVHTPSPGCCSFLSYSFFLDKCSDFLSVYFKRNAGLENVFVPGVNFNVVNNSKTTVERICETSMFHWVGVVFSAFIQSETKISCEAATLPYLLQTLCCWEFTRFAFFFCISMQMGLAE